MARKSSSRAGKDSPGNAPVRFRRNSDTGVTEVDWGRAEDSLLKQAIEGASIVGGAIRFGASRDKGAYAIGIYVNGEVQTEWLPCTGDINELLGEIIDYFRELEYENGLENPKQVID